MRARRSAVSAAAINMPMCAPGCSLVKLFLRGRRCTKRRPECSAMTDLNTKNSDEGSAVFPSARVGVAGPSLKTVAARSQEMNRRCAIHEGSGHALVGIALLGPSSVAEVSIVPGPGYQGRCIGPEYR